MDLKSLPLKKNYTSYNDQILNSFFIPVLSNSCKYDRISGFFSSKLYPLVFCGLKEFIKINGKIRLISGFIPYDEIDLIGKKFDEIKEIYLSKLNKEIINLTKIPKNLHLHLLGYLLVNNLIEIKLALILNKDGRLASKKEIIELNNGMLHEKIGIFYDKEGNSISFSGSNNETVYGWLINREEFKVYNNWDESRIYWRNDVKKFETYWEDKEPFLKVISLPNDSIEILKQSVPKDFNLAGIEKINYFYRQIEKVGSKILNNRDIDIIINKVNSDWIFDENQKIPVIETLKLRKCQSEAIKSWQDNRCSGIFQMATGSGKTLAAIRGSYSLFQRNSKLLVIVTVPDKFLVQQWKENLRKFIKRVYALSSSERDPLKNISNFIKGFRREIFSCGFIVTTLKSLPKIILMTSVIPESEILLISDEVHSVGSENVRNILETFQTKFRLGLSATPERLFDDEGTDFIFNYFDGIIYEFSIKNGQEAGYLCEYEYIPILCDLEGEEIELYADLTRKMRNCDPDDDKEIFQRLAMKRAAILKKAVSKIPKFDQLIQKLISKNQLNYGVIFCDDYSQVRPVEDILERCNVNFAPFDGNTSLEMRKKLREQLSSNSIDILLAKKCLDQGVDIPNLEIGIFLSSTGNPRQFIQRAGRLIRKVPNRQKHVKIYDFITIPTILKPGEDVFDSIMRHEYYRIKYFLQGTDDLNAITVINKIFKKTKDPNVIDILGSD